MRNSEHQREDRQLSLLISLCVTLSVAMYAFGIGINNFLYIAGCTLLMVVALIHSLASIQRSGMHNVTYGFILALLIVPNLVYLAPLVRTKIQTGTSSAPYLYSMLCESGATMHSDVSADILFLGDSITAGWVNEGSGSWAKYFLPMHAADAGVAGYTVRDVQRCILGNTPAASLHPKAVVLLIGTNDVFTATSLDIVKDVKELLREIREKYPRVRVLLLGILPRSQLPVDPVREKIAVINNELRQLAAADVMFFDVGPALLDENGIAGNGLKKDMVHLSGSGYELLADKIHPALQLLLR